jgi:acyl carrier protein phosphodiesterase
MNYLAHIYLSFDDDEILIGNFIADFIRNKEVSLLSKQQQNGVLLHRHIDAYTDIHPLVRQVTKIFRPTHSKYSPVVSDIVFDYILAKNWKAFHNDKLSEFKQASYNRLQSNLDGLPPKANLKVSAMSNGDFINSYESLEGLSYVFKRMDERTKFPSDFQSAIEVVEKNEDSITSLFLEFFPELITQSKLFIEGFSTK